MDLTFHTGEGCLNCRVAALFVHEGRLLIMRDEGITHWYLPGGRMALHETAEMAILREVEEELGVRGRIIRPLWLNQGFFTLDGTGERYHELCIYFLLEDTSGALWERGLSFTREENGGLHNFAWMPFAQLEEMFFYPVFLKKAIFRLPEQFTLHTEVE